MAILVTGGAGYIGSIVVEELLKDNNQVIVLDNLQEGHRGAVLPEAIFVEGDLADRKILDGVFQEHGIEAVIHMAAETTIEFSMSDPWRYFQNNVVNGLNLLESMREHGVRKMVFSSTAAAYGEPEEVPIREDHPQRPINAYGESKLMFERILDWYHRAYGFKYVSFRYFNAAGASERLGEDHKHESHLIPIVLEAALNNSKVGGPEGRKVEGRNNKPLVVRIFGTDYPTRDGTCVRDYIHVVDLARVHVLALETLDGLGGRVYNLGNGQGYTVREVVEAALKLTGADIPLVETARRPGDPAVLVAGSERARAELGWEPEHPELEEIIGSAWKWKLCYPNGYEDW